MGKEFFWLPWHHGDFLAATQGWTLLERGAYFMLLGAQWQRGGALPADRRRLAGIIGVQLDELESVWPVVSVKFEKTAAGLVNRRLEQHRAVQLSKCEKAREAALLRWKGKSTTDANASADAHANASADASPEHMLQRCYSESESESDSETESKSGSGVSFGDSRPQKRTVRGKAAYEGKEFHQQVIDAYREILPELPPVKVWSQKRQRALNARIRERMKDGKPAETVQYWREFFAKVAQSEFLCGRGRSTDFRADLEWLLRPENFAKVIEGRYAGSRGNGAATHAR
jgi:uncharacterized protein YdaU (DUF1376 family)